MKSPLTPRLLGALALLAALSAGCGPADPALDASIDASRDAGTDAGVDATTDASTDASTDATQCVGYASNCEVNPCCDGLCCGQELDRDGAPATWPSCMSAAPPGGFCHLGW